MKTVLIIDGQGGGFGRTLIEKLRQLQGVLDIERAVG